MKLWVDDLRKPPPDSIWVKSVNSAIYQLQNSFLPITELDLDHDAGDFAHDGGDYIEILKWMEKEGINNIPIHLHTMNPVGKMNMRAIIEHNGWMEV